MFCFHSRKMQVFSLFQASCGMKDWEKEEASKAELSAQFKLAFSRILANNSPIFLPTTMRLAIEIGFTEC